MKDELTHIACNEAVAERTYRLRAPVSWSSFEPGQFVMVEIPGGERFLRRPFGIAALKEGELEIFSRVVGRGTEALSRAPAGTALRILGPLGRGFRAPAGMRTALLVAGGYGIAPLVALAARFREEKIAVRVYYGAKHAGAFFCRDELAAIGAELLLTTEDGSLSERGLVTAPLEREIAAFPGPALFACGPRGMLEAVAAIGRARGVPAQVSLESFMACGLGLCQGCVCLDRDGNYQRVCREGPVFDAADIAWKG